MTIFHYFCKKPVKTGSTFGSRGMRGIYSAQASIFVILYNYIGISCGVSHNHKFYTAKRFCFHELFIFAILSNSLKLFEI